MISVNTKNMIHTLKHKALWVITFLCVAILLTLGFMEKQAIAQIVDSVSSPTLSNVDSYSQGVTMADNGTGQTTSGSYLTVNAQAGGQVTNTSGATGEPSRLESVMGINTVAATQFVGTNPAPAYKAPAPVAVAVAPTRTYSGTNFESSCSGGSLISNCGNSDPAPSCPGGYTMYGGLCYPSQYCSTVDTNGSAKGGMATVCSIPTPRTNNVGNNGVTPPPPPINCNTPEGVVLNGQSHTFFLEGVVPYGSTCEGASRTCNNGSFGGNATYAYSRCTIGDAPQVTGLWIKATPALVRQSEDSTITWNGGNAEACTVKGWSLDTSGLAGSELIADFVGESTYTLTCTLGPNSKSATTTVKILPTFEET